MPNKLHDQIFDFLEQYRSNHPEFVYWFRERNTRNRLTEGFWFQGNENYAFIGLYDWGGGSNMTRSVGFLISLDGDKIGSRFEVVFNEEKDQRLLKFYNDIMSSLGGFVRLSDTRYYKTLSEADGLKAVAHFLDHNKPSLDKLVVDAHLEQLFISPEEFNQKLQRILEIRKNKNHLTSMVPAHKIPELKKRYEAFKSEPFYASRVTQLSFVDWARDVILETLKAPLSNESATGLIQILKHNSRAAIVESYLKKNIVDHLVRDRLMSQFTLLNQTGFTGAGKAAIKKLSSEQLVTFRSFLINAASLQSIDAAVKLVEEFSTLNLPEVKSGVFSPWLYYLKPEIFPIFNNSHADFINWCEQPTNYPTAIRLFHEVAEILGERNMGLIDAFAHKFINRNQSSKNNSIEMSDTDTIPLNTILYGPPGTGKTYNTITKAVQIINPHFFSIEPTREEVREEYNRLKADGQIEFITFHQSMSYEDFIEGIKPKKPQEGDEFLQYVISEGVFKRLAKRADYKPTIQAAVFSLTDEDFAKASFYKLSLGNTAIADDEQIYRYCIDNGLIALGWGGAIDFKGKTEHDIQLMVPAELSKFEAQAVNYFIHYLKKDDYVVVSYGNLRFRAIGKVTGDYEYRTVDGLEVKQFRKVEWLLKDVDIPVEELYNRQFSQQTIYKLDRREIKKEFFVKGTLPKTKVVTKKNYVLIIDEINRGNIAQIFGELITLIEPDKRSGASEALEVLLPYSKEIFSVPNNLYLIGTMNTADRSVEALDTALRRRFVFEPMMPNPKLLSPKKLLTDFFNKDQYFELGWKEEPFLSNVKGLYELVGIEDSIEDELDKVLEIDDTGLWQVEHMSIIDDSKFKGVNLQSLLQTINDRLEVLLSRDHTIGHAWLMEVYGLPDLRSAFKNKIIPLLQEYFYNDYEKIGWILGEGFFEEPPKLPVNFTSFSYGSEEDSYDFETKRLLRFSQPDTWKNETFIRIYNPAYKSIDKTLEEASYE